MGFFDAEICKAKQDLLRTRQEDWRRGWAVNNRAYLGNGMSREAFEDALARAPEAPDDLITNWFVVQWPTGYLVADADCMAKLPKRTFNKIMKLGG